MANDITKGKATEAALRESAERFRFLAESMPHITFTAKPNGDLDYFNQELTTFTGLPAETIKGWGWTQFVHPADVEKNVRAWKHSIETGEPFAFEHRFRRADGVYRWFLCRAVPMRDAQGKIIMWVGTNTDIDELKRDEQTRARLAAIVDSSEDAILSKDLAGVVTSWNAGAERLLGYTADEMIGRSIFDLIPPEHRAEEAGLLEQLREGKIISPYETKRLARDGRQVEVSLTLSPIRDSNGKVIGASSITRDITENKKIEAALRESEERFRSLADNMGPLAWMGNADGYITFYNRRWYEYTGTDYEQMQGWGWEKVHHPDHLSRVIAKWRDNLAKGEAWEDTFPLRGKDGTYRWFLSRAFPLRNSEGNITRWFGTNTDVTELRDAQESLKQAQQELRRHAVALERTVAERTAELNRTISELEAFSYSLSHDMRAPLRAIRNFSQIVLDEEGPKMGEDSRIYLGKVASSAERLDRLIADVLVFSRISQDKIELRPMEVQPLLEQIIAERPELQAPQAHIRIESPLPAVLGHEASLTQCFTNLLSNAVKFIAPGVTPQVRIWGQIQDRQVRLWFGDNGIGIAASDQPKLFGMFQRAHNDRQYEGTGIGLAIVHKAVERMHGTAGFESEPGQGSKFWIQLPRPL